MTSKEPVLVVVYKGYIKVLMEDRIRTDESITAMDIALHIKELDKIIRNFIAEVDEKLNQDRIEFEL